MSRSTSLGKPFLCYSIIAEAPSPFAQASSPSSRPQLHLPTRNYTPGAVLSSALRPVFTATSCWAAVLLQESWAGRNRSQTHSVGTGLVNPRTTEAGRAQSCFALHAGPSCTWRKMTL